NVFWHASDPNDAANVLNNELYTGVFSSYHKQRGYYASMGGRDNTTTRFRRYPRTEGGSAVTHISLADRDEQQEYLIKPDHTHTIQLVVYKDVVQYIVDGRVFYEIREGDEVTLEGSESDRDGRALYDTDRFPAYDGGWVGFRMVNSHHVYSNFRVYRLNSK
ncbi:MAG: right-handed parallel beta-helix repeat-containing protein, partial [Balneolaceae bacterium]